VGECMGHAWETMAAPSSICLDGAGSFGLVMVMVLGLVQGLVVVVVVGWGKSMRNDDGPWLDSFLLC
jgi:hypothetical protein